MIPRAIWRLTAYCAPAFHLNFQVTRPAKPVKYRRVEVGSRKSEFRTAECRTSTRSNDWFTSTFYIRTFPTSKFYILHSTFYICFSPAFYIRFTRSSRCYPLLFWKIKSNIANEISWLRKPDSVFPCINRDYSESSPASISVHQCLELRRGNRLMGIQP